MTARLVSSPYTRSDLAVHPGSVLNLANRLTFRRNRWMPHIGDKERARHAGRPDGRMHRTPHEAAQLSTDWSRNPGRIKGDVVELANILHRAPGTGPDHKAAEAVQQSSEANGSSMFVGQVVDWTSSGTAKRGAIGHVVPAGKIPADLGIKLKSDGGPRDHESYVVIADGRTYWPRVSLLKLTVPN